MVRWISAIGLHRSDSTMISASGGRREGRRQAGARGGIVNHRLGDLLDHVARAGRPRQAGNADPFAALDQDLGERERHHQGAVELGLARRAASLNAIEGERSGQIHTVCAASHSCSRT